MGLNGASLALSGLHEKSFMPTLFDAYAAISMHTSTISISGWEMWMNSKLVDLT
jgi:hypothetical protein